MGTPSPFETYRGLRELALNTKVADLGLTDLASTDAYGSMMEMMVGDGAVTLVAFFSGEASLYASTGMGLIGAGRHENVRGAAKAFVGCAAMFVSRMAKTTKTDLPKTGMTTFYVLTPSGRYFASEWEQDLVVGESDFSPLFGAGQAVITAMRPLLQQDIAAAN